MKDDIKNYWHKYAPQMKQGAKIYLSVCLVLMALVGTYGFYLTRSNSNLNIIAPAGERMSSTDPVDVAVAPPVAPVRPAPEPPPGPVALAPVPRPIIAPVEPLPAILPIAAPVPAISLIIPTEITPQPPLEAEAVVAPQVVAEPSSKAVDPALMPSLSGPSTAPISRKFGLSYDPVYQDYRYHDGLDYAIGTDGAICAVADGTIGDISTDLAGLSDLTIIHQGYITIYRHLNQIAVAPGQQVPKGALLGAIASGGTLHFGAEK